MFMAHHDYFRSRRADLDLEEVMRLVQYLPHPHDWNSKEERVMKTVSFLHYVPPVIQKGPMCGLVGITMATQLLQQQQQRKEESFHIPSSDSHHPECILEYATRHGLTYQGEMFSSEGMKQILEAHLSLRAEVINTSANMPNSALQVLNGVLSTNSTVLVPYDADRNHSPCLAQGHQAHWCVLVGVCLMFASEDEEVEGLTMKPTKLLKCCSLTASADNNHYVVSQSSRKEFASLFKESLDSHAMRELMVRDRVHVFARHGKSAHLGLWSLKDLLESNGNLVEVDPKRADPLEYVIPQGGLKEGLRNKVIVVSK